MQAQTLALTHSHPSRRRPGRRPALLLLGLILVSGCAELSPTQQRMLTGGALGAPAGAGVSAIAGGDPMTGAAIGGVGGAATGYVLSKRR